MFKLRTAVIACGATFLFAGAAFAAAEKFHTMRVDLPDGSVAHITYAGDVAPNVAVEPANPDEIVTYDPFAAMDGEMAAMQQQVADIQRTGAGGQPGQVVVSRNLPAGSSYSSTTVWTSDGKSTCTQTVEWRADGPNQQPRMTQASSGDCDSIEIYDQPLPAATPAKPPQRVKPDPRSI